MRKVLTIYAKRLITKSGLSNKESAEHCGLSQSAINNLFSKENKLSMTTFDKIISAFNPNFYDDIGLIDVYKDRIKDVEQINENYKRNLLTITDERERA